LPEGAKPTINLQLSSPIEEGTLNTVYDPLRDPQSQEGSMVTFRGVETTVATLTVSAKDADIPLGASTPHEVAPLFALDAMNIEDKYVAELPVAIVAEESVVTTATVSATAAEEDTSGNAAVASGKEGLAQDDDQVQAEVAVTVQSICTVTLRITYKPSTKDQREELYELLNVTSQRKATALDNLRKISMQEASANRSSATGGPESVSASSSSATVAKPSVKPGFLNKQKEDNTESKWTTWYNRTVGPNSIIRNGAMLAFAAKDFFIFFGAVAFFHFKGQLLAIPPPV
jgi:hypothetical protein